MYRNSHYLYFLPPFRTFQLNYLIARWLGDRRMVVESRGAVVPIDHHAPFFFPAISKSITDLFGIAGEGLTLGHRAGSGGTQLPWRLGIYNVIRGYI